MIRISYSEFITLTQNKKANIQYFERDYGYDLCAVDGTLHYICVVKDSADISDFEANYKASANKTIIEADPDGRQIVRSATTSKGWRYLAHVLEVQTSTVGGCFSQDWQGSSRADFTLKFYDDQDQELTTQQDLDSSCVKTVLTLSPDYDYDIIGGNIHQYSTPTENVRLWVVAGAPELGAAGVKEFVGGLNMKYMGINEQIQTDGRSSARMKKVTEGVPYNTNQMQYIIKHPAGIKHDLMLVVEYFRA